MAGTSPATRNSYTRLRLVERFYPHDRSAMIAADPEHRPASRLLDKDAPDVGRARQQILRHRVGLGVKTRHQVGMHRTGPDLAVFGGHDVIGIVPLRRHRPFPYFV